ncbi:hypothetical protein, partial [Candidatus Binatus sp.]|uniref:hypothetical protein n=1 Tax=Candidatus Binatus sp. TaxID=2811406 RepID=UPI003BEBDB04
PCAVPPSRLPDSAACPLAATSAPRLLRTYPLITSLKVMQSSPKGHRIEIEAGKPLIQFHCSRCKRDFVEDPPSGARYDVSVSACRFRRFPDLIAKGWLEELCPGAPLPYDIEVRSKFIENRPK